MPSNCIEPDWMKPGGGTSRMIERAVMDLPDPDSPDQRDRSSLVDGNAESVDCGDGARRGPETGVQVIDRK